MNLKTVMLQSRHSQVIFLITDGFNEAALGVFLCKLRQIGIAVSVVGLRSTQVRGAHGLIILPDKSLNRLLEDNASILALILLTEDSYLKRLNVDPRVSRLLQNCVESGITIAGLNENIGQFIRGLVVEDSSKAKIFTPSVDVTLDEFASGFVQHLYSVQGII